VIDGGPGVPEDQLARLTERAFRLEEARSRAPEGLGLGLSIALVVAERHGLSLSLRRSEHGGLEVELRGAIAA
jgi:signal transduction histidine kinase